MWPSVGTDGWVPTVQCSMKLAELHLRQAQHLSEGQGSQAQLSQTCQHHLLSCDRLLASVQLRMFEQERSLLQQPSSPATCSPIPDSCEMTEHEGTLVIQGHADSSAETTAVRYHWTRGSMSQLQGDQDQALLHFNVCEELCKRCALS